MDATSSDAARVGALFEKLREEAERTGLLVRVVERGPGQTRGSFVGHRDPSRGSSHITIRSPNRRRRDNVEAILLAHEMGHRRAFERKEESEVYEPFYTDKEVTSDLPPEEASAVMRAEIRAWLHAWSILEELDAHGSWGSFQKIAIGCMRGYLKNLRGLKLCRRRSAKCSDIDWASER